MRRNTIGVIGLLAALACLVPISDAAWQEPTDPPALFYFAPRVKTLPKLDGRLGDECWKTAPVMTDFGVIHTNEGLAKKQSFVQMVYDDEAIYVSVRALEPEIDRMPMKKQLTARDSAIWHGDSFEVYLRPNLKKTDRYHLCGNTKGGRFDAYGRGGPFDHKESHEWGEGTQWRVYGHIGKSSWTHEWRIPYADFGIVRGRSFSFNLCRITWTPASNQREFSAWQHCTYEQKDFRQWGFFVFDAPNVDYLKMIERLVPGFRDRFVSWPTEEGLAILDHGKRSLKPYYRLGPADLSDIDLAVAAARARMTLARKAGFKLDEAAAILTEVSAERARLADRLKGERFSRNGVSQFRKATAAVTRRARDAEWKVKLLLLAAE